MIEELIDKLNNLKILQKSIDWREDVPDDIWFKYLEEAEYLDLEPDIDKHRHYELSTDIFKINDKYLGVRRISMLYSEMSDCEDIHHTLEFFEVKQIKTITYEKL